MSDNISIKDGSGATVVVRSKDVGSGVEAPFHLANPPQHVLSSTLTRSANTTAYAGSTTSPQAIGNSTPVVTPTITASASTTASGKLLNLRLIKSTTGSTGATFRVYVFTSAPTVTGIADASTFTPKLADINASPTKYVGHWDFSSQQVNGDNSVYNGTSGTNVASQAFQLADGSLYFVVTTTGAYAPGNAETFYLLADFEVTVP